MKTTTNLLQDISDNVDLYILDVIEEFERDFPISKWFKLIYSQSIINLEDHYENCARLSHAVHESQKDIDALEYYVFNNRLIYISKIIDEQNAQTNQEGDTNDQYQSMKNDMQKHQKNMTSSFKMPKVPNFKI